MSHYLRHSPAWHTCVTHLRGTPASLTCATQAPKRYTFETWNLPVSEGGFVKVYTPGRSTPEAQAWPGVAEDMVREVSGLPQAPPNR